AVIADEAHRHHGNGTTEQIQQILAGLLLGGGAGGGGGRRHVRGVQPRQQPRGLTFFGFTATPSPKALQLFGVATEVPADPWVDETSGVSGQHGSGSGGRQHAGPHRRHRLTTDSDQQAREQQQQQRQRQQEERQEDLLEALMFAGGGGGAGGSSGREASRRKRSDNSGGHDNNSDGAKAPRRESSTALLYTPFHCYSMRSAVRDGFVLDVLRCYSCVMPRLRIAGVGTAGAAAEGASLDGVAPHPGNTAGAADATGAGAGVAAPAPAAPASIAEEGVLVEAASNSRQVVERKAAYILQRFTAQWRRAAAAGFPCLRGMLVARSRQHVVWYVQPPCSHRLLHLLGCPGPNPHPHMVEPPPAEC
ncbi:hypothetical protein Agub_g6164, partial [Astrephomene gubernaculifera]